MSNTKRCPTCHAVLPDMFHEPWCRTARWRHAGEIAAYLAALAFFAYMWAMELMS